MAKASDYRKFARQRAEHYGLDPDIFDSQMFHESGYNPHAVSQAGARGVAQFMPDTAAGLGVNPDDPYDALDGAAKLMAGYVRKYGSYRNALVAYNAGPGRVGKPLFEETRKYISRILGGVKRPTAYPGQQNSTRGGGQEGQQQEPVEPQIQLPSPSPLPPISSPTPPAGIDARIYLASTAGAGGSGPTPLPQFPPSAPSPAANQTAPEPRPQQPTASPAEPPAPAVQPRSRLGRVLVAAGANRPGVELRKPLVGLLEKASGIYRRPIKVTTGTNHSKYTSTGNVSDHFPGDGADMGLGGDSRRNRAIERRGDAIAASILIAAGVQQAKAVRMARKGGAFNVEHNGRRLQLIWKSDVGGDHWGHVHAGYR